MKRTFSILLGLALAGLLAACSPSAGASDDLSSPSDFASPSSSDLVSPSMSLLPSMSPSTSP